MIGTLVDWHLHGRMEHPKPWIFANFLPVHISCLDSYPLFWRWLSHWYPSYDMDWVEAPKAPRWSMFFNIIYIYIYTVTMENNHYQHIFVIHKTILNNWWYVDIQLVKKLVSPIHVLPLAGPAEQHLEAQHCPQWNCWVPAWRLGVSSHQWSIWVGVFRSILGFQDV